MIEAAVSAAVAIIAAGAALTNRIHNRMSDLDRRIDTFSMCKDGIEIDGFTIFEIDGLTTIDDIPLTL